MPQSPSHGMPCHLPVNPLGCLYPSYNSLYKQVMLSIDTWNILKQEARKIGISISKLISNRFSHASGTYDPGSNPVKPVVILKKYNEILRIQAVMRFACFPNLVYGTRMTRMTQIFTDNNIRAHPRNPRNPCSIT